MSNNVEEIINILMILDKINNKKNNYNKNEIDNKKFIKNNNFKTLITPKHHHQHYPYQEENHIYQHPL